MSCARFCAAGSCRRPAGCAAVRDAAARRRRRLLQQRTRGEDRRRMRALLQEQRIDEDDGRGGARHQRCRRIRADGGRSRRSQRAGAARSRPLSLTRLCLRTLLHPHIGRGGQFLGALGDEPDRIGRRRCSPSQSIGSRTVTRVPLPEPAANIDLAAMQPHQALHDRQAEAGAVVPAVVGRARLEERPRPAAAGRPRRCRRRCPRPRG